MDDSPSCVLRIDGGLSPLGNLEADDAIDVSRQELTVDTYKITYYCSPRYRRSHERRRVD